MFTVKLYLAYKKVERNICLAAKVKCVKSSISCMIHVIFTALEKRKYTFKAGDIKATYKQC